MRTLTEAMKSVSKYREISWTTLFAVFGSYQCVLHVYYSFLSKDPKVLLPAAVAFIHDLFLLSIFCLTAYTICLLIPKRIKSFAALLFSIVVVLLACVFALYPGMLRDLLVFPVNIFHSDLSTSKVVLFKYLGLMALIPALIAMCLGVVCISRGKRMNIPASVKIAGFAMIVIVSVLFLKRPSPQPVLYSIQEQIKTLFSREQRIVPSLNILNKHNDDTIKVVQYPETRINHYNHVLVIVLEGITDNDFQKEFMTIPDGYFKQNQTQSVYYDTYYTNNLDSYTSLIAMLTGIHVPYRCYADDTLYDQVNSAPNLVSFFNQQYYYTSFVSTFEYHPYIPSRESWNQISIRKDFQDKQNYVSIGTSRMEMATEDKLAIPEITDQMKQHDKTFIMHELAYGHSPQWRAKMKIPQLQYYNDYLCDLTNEIKQADLWDETLMIIVSDHGDRAGASNVENYHVPLLLTGNTLKESVDTRFLSHCDLPGILFSALGIGQHPEPADKIFCVGSTEKWVYGIISPQTGHVLIDDTRGVILSNSKNRSAQDVHDIFQRYVNEFNYRYGKY